MEIWAVEGPWSGRLAVCSRPRAGWFLEDDLHVLRGAGFHTLVSALTPEEVIRAELERVQALCDRIGLAFENFPVGNLQVPVVAEALPSLSAWDERLHRGEGVAFHCWASVGRSPTLAAALLISAGVEATEAWARLEAARGREVPDTLEQRAWAAAFASPDAVIGT